MDLAELKHSGRTADVSNEPEGAEQWVRVHGISRVNIIWKEGWGQGMIESQETRVLSLIRGAMCDSPFSMLCFLLPKYLVRLA